MFKGDGWVHHRRSPVDSAPPIFTVSEHTLQGARHQSHACDFGDLKKEEAEDPQNVSGPRGNFVTEKQRAKPETIVGTIVSGFAVFSVPVAKGYFPG
jgi:hypothetical protein